MRTQLAIGSVAALSAVGQCAYVGDPAFRSRLHAVRLLLGVAMWNGGALVLLGAFAFGPTSGGDHPVGLGATMYAAAVVMVVGMIQIYRARSGFAAGDGRPVKFSYWAPVAASRSTVAAAASSVGFDKTRASRLVIASYLAVGVLALIDFMLAL